MRAAMRATMRATTAMAMMRVVRATMTMSEICDVREHGARLQITKEQKPPLSVLFLPVCHMAFKKKVYGAFFVCFLVGKDRGPVVISMRK